MMQREYKTTEFWTIAAGVVLYIADRYTSGGVLDGIDPSLAVTEARAQVVAIAAQLRQATGSESGLIVYAAGLVYLLRKIEKITRILRGGADEPTAHG